MKYIAVTAKCNDLCNINIFDDAVQIYNSDDYVPEDLGIGGGDYIELLIEVKTGKICGWDADKVNKTISELIEIV